MIKKNQNLDSDELVLSVNYIAQGQQINNWLKQLAKVTNSSAHMFVTGAGNIITQKTALRINTG